MGREEGRMTATDELRRMPKRTRISGKWYNLTVQVAAGRTIKYTAECAIGVRAATSLPVAFRLE